MKFFIFIFLCFYFHISSAQVSDNFDDGNFTSNPIWSGDTPFFVINSAKQLQSNGPPLTADVYLSSPSTLLQNAEWSFLLKLNFAPSSNNYARIYLVSDKPDLRGSLNGYYIKIGENGTSDAIEIYRQTGLTSVKILRGIAAHVSFMPNIRIKITLDYEGNWTIFSDLAGGNNFVEEATINNFLPVDGLYFGIVCSFTSTNKQGFIFDDFVVKPSDFVKYVMPENKDLIFTEILADENPRVDLPSAEFIELHNRGQFDLNLKGFTLSDQVSTAIFPKYILRANEYLIVCRNTDTLLFESYGKVVGLTNFPTLNNDGDHLMLKEKRGTVTDEINYNTSWYNNSDKSDGGWSLEIIDENNICGEGNNWAASEDIRGGSPGKVNSISASNPDLTPPKLINISIDGPAKITIYFDEKIDTSKINNENIKIDKSIIISSIKPLSSDYKSIELVLSSDLILHEIYNLSCNQISDNCGNLSGTLSMPFSLPEQGDSSDVIINEVLFNPRVGGVDFVEIYNRSNKYIDLKNWRLGSINSHGTVDTILISGLGMELFPKDYLLITTDKENISTNYPKSHTDRFLIVKKIPAYNNDLGTVLLFNNQQKLIERFDYNQNFHSKLLNNNEGVSLERINPEMYGNTRENWHSAASTEGFATPGYKNSQLFVGNSLKQPLDIEPRIFTPDDDGNLDFTTINYSFFAAGNVANIIIFDSNGREVKKIAQNKTLSTEGFFTWDGTNTNGEKVRIGAYIVYCQIYNLNSDVNEFKETVVVGGKF